MTLDQLISACRKRIADGEPTGDVSFTTYFQAVQLGFTNHQGTWFALLRDAPAATKKNDDTQLEDIEAWLGKDTP